MKTSTKLVGRIGATLALAGGLVAGGVAVASATSTTSTTSTGAPGAPPSPGAQNGPRMEFGRLGGGRVTAVTATSLTVTTLSGKSQSFVLTPSTTYDKDGTTVTSSALTTGEQVLVVPTQASSSSSTPTADRVLISSPALGGSVISVTGAAGSRTIVVEDAEGFYRTITTSPATTYLDDGKPVSAPTIATGSLLGARGTIDANHTTLDATEVILGPAGGVGGFGGPGGFSGFGGFGGLRGAGAFGGGLGRTGDLRRGHVPPAWSGGQPPSPPAG